MTPKEQHLADTLRAAGVTLIQSSTAFEVYNKFYAFHTDETLRNAQDAVNEAQLSLQEYWDAEEERRAIEWGRST